MFPSGTGKSVRLEALARPETEAASSSAGTHLWGFFFFIMFAETPACSEETHQTLITLLLLSVHHHSHLYPQLKAPRAADLHQLRLCGPECSSFIWRRGDSHSQTGQTSPELEQRAERRRPQCLPSVLESRTFILQRAEEARYRSVTRLWRSGGTSIGRVEVARRSTTKGIKPATRSAKSIIHQRSSDERRQSVTEAENTWNSRPLRVQAGDASSVHQLRGN